jgi:hypothetical protein
VANLFPCHTDFNLCQQHLDTISRLRLAGWLSDSWLGQPSWLFCLELFKELCSIYIYIYIYDKKIIIFVIFKCTVLWY